MFRFLLAFLLVSSVHAQTAFPPFSGGGGGGGGAGDVVGPGSAVDDNFAAFDGTTGKLIKDSGVSASSFGDVTGPGSSTDNALCRFDSTTGKIIQNSGAILDDSDNLTGVTSITVGQGTAGSPSVVVGTASYGLYENGYIGVSVTGTEIFRVASGLVQTIGGVDFLSTGDLSVTLNTSTTQASSAAEFYGPNLALVAQQGSGGDAGQALFRYNTTDDTLEVNVNNGGWFTVQDSSGFVAGPASAVDDRIATFDGTTGKLIQDSGTLVSDLGDVNGPASAVDDRIATFDGVTGKLIQDSGTLVSDLGDVSGPASVVDDRIATFDGTTGKLIQDSGTLISDLGDVSGPGSSTDNALARFDSSTGKILLNSGVTLDDSDILTGVAQVLADDGALGTPAYGFASESGLGIYRPGSQLIDIVANSLTVARFGTSVNGLLLSNGNGLTSSGDISLLQGIEIYEIDNQGNSAIRNDEAGYVHVNDPLNVTGNTSVTGDVEATGSVIAAGVTLGGINRQEFTTSGTWTKPTGAKWYQVYGIGGAGGAGSGRMGAAGTARGGGGGGSPGGVVSYFINDPDFFDSSETVTIGSGGTGGAGQTSDDTDGNAGSNGGNTTITTAGGSSILAIGGDAGNGGVAGTSSAINPTGNFYTSGSAPNNTTSGLGSSTTGNSGNTLSMVNAFSTRIDMREPLGAGGGGGVDSGDTHYAGGNAAQFSSAAGSHFNSYIGTTRATPSAGTAGGGAGSNGNSTPAWAIGGQGGTGGGGNNGGNGGDGGDGTGYGAPGGGGGGCVNGNVSGAGGDGFDGYLVVVTGL